MGRKKSRGLLGPWVERDLRRSRATSGFSHLKVLVPPVPSTHSVSVPTIGPGLGQTDSSMTPATPHAHPHPRCPCTTHSSSQAHSLPALFWLCSLLEHETPPASFSLRWPWYLNHWEANLGKMLLFLTPDSLSLLAPALYTGSDAPPALHPALLGLRAHPLPAWLLSLLSHNGFCS